MKSAATLGDNPIRDPDGDVLGRLKAARSFARQVLALDASQGVAVGLFGPWGSGKTSFINLTRHEFKQNGIQVVDFNPWMFSGAEQLVDRFFAELSAEMAAVKQLQKVGTAFRKYGDLLSTVTIVTSKLIGLPLVGEVASSLVKTELDAAGQPRSANSLRKEVVDALKEKKKPIVVVLDDVDRLSASEIRDIFKLVRLTGSFPNVIYIVACDRRRVERALDEQGLAGRDYLEKILQVPFDLPEIPPHTLRQQTRCAVDQALANIESAGPFDEQAWCGVYAEIIRPLIRNMRDVRRYAAAIRITAKGLKSKVAQVDMLGLEAMRIFLPDVFQHLPGAIDGLAVGSGPEEIDGDFESGFYTEIDESTGLSIQLTAQIKLMKRAEKPQRGVVPAMIRRLFPAAPGYGRAIKDYGEEWAAQQLSDGRVAHRNILKFYLERVPPPSD